MLEVAIQNEVAESIEAHKHEIDENGHRKVVRNGKMPERNIVTGVGPIPVQRPRVHDRREGQFGARPAPSYHPIFGVRQASARSFQRFISRVFRPAISQKRFRPFSEKEPLDFRPQTSSGSKKPGRMNTTNGVNATSLKSTMCICGPTGFISTSGLAMSVLASWFSSERPLMASRNCWRCGMVNVKANFSWKEVLLDLKHRGLNQAPALAIGDGALGFWAALREVFPSTREQRCWVHKTANILDQTSEKRPSFREETHPRDVSGGEPKRGLEGV